MSRRAALFDPAPKDRRPAHPGTMVALAPGECPTCGHELAETTWDEAALFWLHGHGYIVRTTLVACGRDGYKRHRSTTSITPRDWSRS